jgi:hypothetical protein
VVLNQSWDFLYFTSASIVNHFGKGQRADEGRLRPDEHQRAELRFTDRRLAGCEKVYRDLVNGARAERPVLERMLAGGSVRLPAGCPRGGVKKGPISFAVLRAVKALFCPPIQECSSVVIRGRSRPARSERNISSGL